MNITKNGIACAASSNDGIWFVDKFYFFLMFWDYKKEIVTEVYSLPDFTNDGVLFLEMIVFENNIFMAPNTESNILVFNIESKMFEEIEVKNACFGIFRSVFCDNNELVFVPNKYNYIVNYSVKTKELSYVPLAGSNLTHNGFNSSYKQGQHVYMSAITDEIFCFNLETKAWEDTIKVTNASIVQVIAVGSTIYAFDNNTLEILAIDRLDRNIINRRTFLKKGVRLHNMFDKYIIAESGCSQLYCIFDLRLNIVWQGEKEIISDPVNYNCFSRWILGSEKVYEIAPGNIINIYNSNLDIRRLKLVFCEEIREKIKMLTLKKWKNKLYKGDFMLNESICFEVDDFINLIVEKQEKK